jgi:hypothetical protein
LGAGVEWGAKASRATAEARKMGGASLPGALDRSLYFILIAVEAI